MMTAHELKKGMFIRHGGKICKVIEQNYHMGGGRAGGTVHLKIRDIAAGHTNDVKIDPHEIVEDLEIERHKMKFLYDDGECLCFMNPESFEQISLGRASVGNFAKFLREEMEIEVEFFDGSPIHINPPEKVVLKVVTTGCATKSGADNVYKSATLEGKVEALVPHFVKNGDKVVIEVESGKYLDRLK